LPAQISLYREKVKGMSLNTLINQFNFGISFLDAYIRLCNKTRLMDINILSEGFMCELLNILYGYELSNVNDTDNLTAGYDLYSDSQKILIQVTSECRPEKITSCVETLQKQVSERNSLEARFKKLEEECKKDPSLRDDRDNCRIKLRKMKDINGYNIKFLFLCTDAAKLKKSNPVNRIATSDKIIFNPQDDILDFSTLSAKVLSIQFSESAGLLQKFMQRNGDIFVSRSIVPNRVEGIIKEYADNYTSKLFLHTYENSKVTLQNLYINPSFSYVDDLAISNCGGQINNTSSRDMIGLLCDFLWQKKINDKERILFVEGDAAIGKTSLVSWLCYHYLQVNNTDATEERQTGRAIFMNRKVVCVRLRELVFSDSSINPCEVVLSYLNIGSIEEFSRQYANAIIILDGADELSMVSGVAASSIESFVLDIRKGFSNHKIIVTTRPHFLNMETFKRNTFRIRRISLDHFSKQMRIEWLEKYKNCQESIPETTEKYILSLTDEVAAGVADTPLALYLLVRCDMREELQGNQWALFHEIFSKAIVDSEYNENFKNTSNDLRFRKSRTNYRIVERIAYRMFQNSKEERYYIVEKEIGDIIRDTALGGLTPEAVRQTCVLCAYWKNSAILGALEFYHNDIRDYFMCEYISESLCDCLNGSDPEKVVDNIIELCCRIFSWGDIAGTTWEQAFTFLYLRLKYESQYGAEADSLYNLLQRNDCLASLMQGIIESKTLWTYDYKDMPYIAVKYVFRNTMMLFRILMEFLINKYEKTIISLWTTEEDKTQWDRLGIFEDWRELFIRSVNISKHKKIGIVSRTHLANISLERSILNNADFDGATLNDANFGMANMRNCTFTSTHITDVDFSNADLRNADFSGAVLSNVNFTEANLVGAKFVGARITKCTWRNSRFGDNDFSEAHADGLTISGRNVSNMWFSNSVIINSDFRNCKFHDITIANKTRFLEVSFLKAEFEGVISETSFSDCNLSKCRFTALSTFKENKIENCSCTEACFNELTIEKSNFIDCNFKDVSCVGTVFRRTCFSGQKTMLEGSDFSRAKAYNSLFDGLNFYRVHLRASSGFEKYSRENPYLVASR